MAERHLSMRGEEVDFNRLRVNNEKKPALGNASMNARGDILGENGTVIKTQEQIEAEWASRIAEQKHVASGVNIKDPAAISTAAKVPSTTHEVQAPPGLAPKVVDTADAGFDPVFEQEPAQAPKARRKIVESD